MATSTSTKPGLLGGVDRYFGVSESGSSISTELRAGLTTFLAMAYIIVVNPSILSNAITIDNAFPQLLTATVLAAAIGTLFMALWAKLPFALAPGMGLNAYFTFVVVIGMEIPWQTALGAVFVSGILFLIISVTGIREWLISAIPLHLKHAITAGIGAFLAIIGFANAGLIGDSAATLVTRGDWTSPGLWLAMVGLLVSAALLAYRVKGALLIGILVTTFLAIVTGAKVYFGGEGMVSFPGFGDGIVAAPVWPTELFAAMDIGAALGLGVLTVVFTFLFVDFFDTAGTLIGLSEKAGLIDEDGNLTQPRAAFAADAVATTVGAVLGTSSTTSYIESAAGIEDGGRTGLTSATVAVMFLASLFFWPIAGAIPGVATAPVLIVIGAMMMTGATKVDWTDYRMSIPAFLTIVGMPFTYSITDGISLGIISHTILMAITGKAKDVHPIMYVLSALLIWRFFVVG